MPAVFNTAEGIIEIAPEDIQKALPDLITQGKISVSDKNLYKIPPSFKIVENADTCQIDPQPRQRFFCLFRNFMLLRLFFNFVFRFYFSSDDILSARHFGSADFIYHDSSVPVFRRKRIVISPNGIRVKSRWLFFPSFGFLIKPEELEYIYVIHNSYDFKYTLVIGADGQTTHIGRGLPKDDLEWLRNFINAQIKRFVCRQEI